jgi:uncharacterized protein (TIGR00255 family)
MTGFGREEAMIGSYQVIVEIKSLNGKQLDINARIPPMLRPYELEMRGQLNNKLVRGTVELNISVKQEGAAKAMTVNTGLATFYYQGMKQIAEQLNLPQENVLATLMRMPEVVATEQDALPEKEWEGISQLLSKAADNLRRHRQKEGMSLQADLEKCIGNIEQGLVNILPYEPKRLERVRARISGSLEEWVGAANVDTNRLEQELIYYIERIDFSEEKTRLTQHCNYFFEVLHNDEEAKGKKLGFILQEVGREINTLGSKANDADIQKLIVSMKDELEKAKEQVLNVL